MHGIKVEDYLPHRGDWLLLDSVKEFEPGQRLLAVYQVPEHPSWETGHFPGNPIMPGVLLVEAGNQALAQAVALSEGINGLPILKRVGYDFFRPVKPGEIITVSMSHMIALQEGRLNTYRGEIEITNERGKKVAGGFSIGVAGKI